MNNSQTFVLDFVVKGDSPDVMKVVLVEEGDWSDIDARLRHLQERMYGCIDAAIDGQLTDQFPETKGKKIVVSVDFYDAPQVEASEFFERFSENVFLIPSYGEGLKQSRFVKDIVFEANFETLPK
jgi:hypothetical protein